MVEICHKISNAIDLERFSGNSKTTSFKTNYQYEFLQDGQTVKLPPRFGYELKRHRFHDFAIYINGDGTHVACQTYSKTRHERLNKLINLPKARDLDVGLYLIGTISGCLANSKNLLTLEEKEVVFEDKYVDCLPKEFKIFVDIVGDIDFIENN